MSWSIKVERLLHLPHSIWWQWWTWAEYVCKTPIITSSTADQNLWRSIARCANALGVHCTHGRALGDPTAYERLTLWPEQDPGLNEFYNARQVPLELFAGIAFLGVLASRISDKGIDEKLNACINEVHQVNGMTKTSALYNSYGFVSGMLHRVTYPKSHILIKGSLDVVTKSVFSSLRSLLTIDWEWQ